MKKIIPISLLSILVFAACNSGDTKTKDPVPAVPKKIDTTAATKPEETGEPGQLYACPMHPEVKGKKNDRCPKCGMKLTEPVKESKKP